VIAFIIFVSCFSNTVTITIGADFTILPYGQFNHIAYTPADTSSDTEYPVAPVRVTLLTPSTVV
jgi:hypothetical protein